MEFNFEQMGLFGEMTTSEVVAPAPNKEKETKKKAEKTKGKAKKETSKVVDEEVNIPVDIYTPYGNFTASIVDFPENKAKISQLTDWLINMGFEVLKSAFADLKVVEDKIFMTFSHKSCTDLTLIQWGDNDSAELKVTDGMFQVVFKVTDFENSNVSVGDVKKKLVELQPEYENTELQYDPVSNIMLIAGDGVPENNKLMAKKKAKCLNVLGEAMELEEDCNIGELVAAYMDAHTAFRLVREQFSVMYLNREYVPIVIAPTIHSKDSYKISGNDAGTKEKELRVKLPVEVRAIFGSYNLTPEKFNNSQDVSVEEVKEYLKTLPEFRNKRMNLEYVEGVGCFQALIYSASKG